MKKSLVAAVLAGAFAASAYAAPSVTLYGLIDTGVNYTHYRADDGTDSTDTFSMKGSQTAGSRWGLRGSEDLGNGVKVGFTLESGMNTDDGTQTMSRLFGREASVNVSGSYGTLYAGRLGKVTSTAGSIAMGSAVTPFGVLYGDAGVEYFTGTDWGRTDNTIAYRTPAVGGLSLTAEYSFKTDQVSNTTGVENKASADRYAALGLNYKAGAFNGVLLADYTMWKNSGNTVNTDNGYSVLLGGNYNFGFMTLYAQANYFDNQANVRKGLANLTLGDLKHTATLANEGYEGWGVSVGAKVPAFGGNFLAQVGYRDAEAVKGDEEYKRFGVGLAYTYPFSKRTNVYGAATYAQEKDDLKDQTSSATSVMVGLVHRF